MQLIREAVLRDTSLFVCYLSVYLFIHLFLSMLSKATSRSMLITVSAAAVLQVGGSWAHGQQRYGHLTNHCSVAELPHLPINGTIHPKSPSLRLSPLLGLLGITLGLPILSGWRQRSKPSSPGSSDHVRKPHRGISAQRHAVPLQSPSTEAVYTVNKQTQIAGGILFLIPGSSGGERQLQRCWA